MSITKTGAGSSGGSSFLTSKALAFYKNNGTDQSPNGRNLTAVGSPGQTTGFNGVANSAMVLGNGAAYQLLTGSIIDTTKSFSFGMWINNASFASLDTVLTFSRTGPSAQYPYVIINGGANTFAYIDGANQPSDDINPLAANGWGYLLFTFDQPTNTQSLWTGCNGSPGTGMILNTPLISTVSPLRAMQNLYLGGNFTPIGEELDIQDVGFWSYCITGGTTNPGHVAVAGSDVDKLWNNGLGFNPFGTP